MSKSQSLARHQLAQYYELVMNEPIEELFRYNTVHPATLLNAQIILTIIDVQYFEEWKPL